MVNFINLSAQECALFLYRRSLYRLYENNLEKCYFKLVIEDDVAHPIIEASVPTDCSSSFSNTWINKKTQSVSLA